MITKDISLIDCILDLVDNSIDGAYKKNKTLKKPNSKNLKGYTCEISFDSNHFKISDDSSGITNQEAIDYAFHFGRKKPEGIKSKSDSLIGLYGIGMKRAVFKMGSIVDIHSVTQRDSFKMNLNVEEWGKDDNNWDFNITVDQGKSSTGTSILINKLHPSISEEFADPVFLHNLRRVLSRDYFMFLGAGFRIKVNNALIKPVQFHLKESKKFKPAFFESSEDNISIQIISGMMAFPPDDTEPENLFVSAELFGWYVLCNDRVVLAADKTEKSVWGDEDFQTWHPQYNGFFGMVRFNTEKNHFNLPWTTTKRDIDISNSLYRKAISEMKDVTESFINYTNSRKSDKETAKTLEAATHSIDILKVTRSKTANYPEFNPKNVGKKVARIAYQKPIEEAEKVAEALGNAYLSNKEIGLKTFEYYFNKVVGQK